MVLDGGQSMTKPLIVVNFKTYASASGATAETLAVAMEAHSNGPARMVAVVSAFDLEAVRRAAPSLEVWSQHLDPVGQGGFTGWLEPKTAIHRGAQGTIINHAEHKVEMDHVQRLLPQLPEDFPVCGCAADLEEAKSLAEMGPTFIAVEPPELIGGDISVTTADPSIVSDTVAVVKATNPDVRVLCGAGVKNGQDVATAIKLGAEGVLLASGVTKASDVASVLNDLVSLL
ncbi:MAG: triosephosphate isomerase (TIM) [uncultured Candidatus Poseidoniales archaeon]|jgi:triosephosphate isomerase|nr:MAG: triosephosphate isomerase (TIM) [uncultured Candidatus Poseidoniales archaeon]